MGGGRQLQFAPSIADPVHTRGHRITTTSGAITPVPYDEQAIVDRVLAGDRDAFRALVEREGPGVVRACHRVLADLHEAEDAAQEAFVTAFGALATWRGDGPFGAWLTRIAVRIAIRRAGKRKPVTWIDPGDPGAGLDVPGGIDPAAGDALEPSATARSAEPWPTSTSPTARPSRCGTSGSCPSTRSRR